MTEKKQKTGTVAADIETRPCVEFLRVDLTEKEMLDLAKNSSQSRQRAHALEGQLDTIRKQFKTDIEREENIIDSASQKINQGYEMREVDCEWTYDWKTNKRRLKRLDTDEFIRETSIPSDERQTQMQGIIHEDKSEPQEVSVDRPVQPPEDETHEETMGDENAPKPDSSNCREFGAPPPEPECDYDGVVPDK